MTEDEIKEILTDLAGTREYNEVIAAFRELQAEVEMHRRAGDEHYKIMAMVCAERDLLRQAVDEVEWVPMEGSDWYYCPWCESDFDAGEDRTHKPGCQRQQALGYAADGRKYTAAETIKRIPVINDPAVHEALEDLGDGV